MKKLKELLPILLIGSSIILASESCKKIEDPVINDSNSEGTNYLNGALIVNEGSFGAGNGSISFYNYASHNVFNNVFYSRNDRPLGDVIQSVTRNSASTYLCVNVSNKVEVVNSISFESEATISGVNQPRYMTINGTTGYVSCWNNGGEITLVDLNSNSATGTIAVGSGPEKMAISNNNLYVPNSGGFGTDSTISVIDLSSNTVTTTITLNAYNPSAIVNGSANTIWVLARGKVIYDGNWNVIGHEPSKVIEINTLTNTVVSTTLLHATHHPSNIAISPNGSTLYFGGSYAFPGIYAMSTSNPATPSGLFINQLNYGFFINATTGNLFILKDASSANGKLIRYSPSGSKLDENTVGIFPNGGVS